MYLCDNCEDKHRFTRMTTSHNYCMAMQLIDVIKNYVYLINIFFHNNQLHNQWLMIILQLSVLYDIVCTRRPIHLLHYILVIVIVSKPCYTLGNMRLWPNPISVTKFKVIPKSSFFLSFKNNKPVMLTHSVQ